MSKIINLNVPNFFNKIQKRPKQKRFFGLKTISTHLTQGTLNKRSSKSCKFSYFVDILKVFQNIAKIRFLDIRKKFIHPIQRFIYQRISLLIQIDVPNSCLTAEIQ